MIEKIFQALQRLLFFNIVDFVRLLKPSRRYFANGRLDSCQGGRVSKSPSGPLEVNSTH
ncbi:hypothetical protein [uncultured Desulfuromusa sp.]|uniref:hypothetical protein n=1 Tax=uncultured Desulfuromusa sp. TaxID=219183 RepID=UPI002AA8649B|nr:hypothetical protein [uncultured Desulfuromusa sp.]